MLTLETILAGLVALFGGLAWLLKARGDRQKTRADAERERAERNQAAANQQGKASQALRDTAARQRERRTPPDTEARDDLEGDW